MSLPSTPLKGHEPPDGDFARYIEQLPEQTPPAGSNASGPVVNETNRPSDASAATRVASGDPVQTASSAPDVLPSRFGDLIQGVSPRKAAPWMIAAGIGLLLASLPQDPLIASPVPGIVLIGAGLAIGRHFKGR